jgi:alginate O-acetyltransferase complex protein AlgJ
MTDSFAGRLYGILLMGFFGCAATLGGILTFVGHSGVVANEKRETARLEMRGAPVPLEKMPKVFEAFFADNFGFRKSLIRLDSRISDLFGVLPTDRVVVGRNDWLFFAADRSIELYQNALPFSDGQLDLLSRKIGERRDQLAQKGIGYLFTIGPDKHTIYPELMPSRFPRRHLPSQHSQVMDIAARDRLPILDLRAPLLEAKSLGQVYYRDDTHWNELGAAVAHAQIVAALPKSLGIETPPVAHEDFSMAPRGPGDLAVMALLQRQESVPAFRAERLPCAYQVLEEKTDSAGRQNLLRTRCPDAKHKLLFVHDSFGMALIPHLAAEFGEMVAIWNDGDKEAFDARVEAERPDFVIDERVERGLKNMMPP